MIVHTVLFELDPTKRDEVDAALDALRSLVVLDGVLSMIVGADNSPEDLNFGYTHAAVAVFESPEARDAYLRAPQHLMVVAMLQKIMRRVVVVDFDA